MTKSAEETGATARTARETGARRWRSTASDGPKTDFMPPRTLQAFQAWVTDAKRAQRSLAVAGLAVLAIALTLTMHEGGAWGSHLRYSLAIGLSCLVVAEGTRSLLSRLRAAAGWSSSGWEGPLIDLLIATTLATVAGPVLGTSIIDLWMGNEVSSLLVWNQKEVRISYLMACLGTLVTLAVVTISEHASAEAARARAALREAAEFRLKLVELQLDPHLLANTLAHLRAVLDEDPRQAQAVLDRLISFFRATLAGSRAVMHTVQEEVSRLEDYLAIIQMRMGSRLRVSVTVPPELRRALVPALISQPLVENAVRHGIEPKVGPGAIDVLVRQQDGGLLIDVRDTGRGFDDLPTHVQPGSGFGIEQVRDRLRTLYGAGASLSYLPASPPTVTDDLGGVIARLALPLERMRAAPSRTEEREAR